MLHRRLLSFGALIILPLAALLFYGAYQQRREALVEARAGVVRATHAVADRHRVLIERTEALLVVLARIPKIREGDWGATNDILAEVVRQFPEYLNLRVSDLEGAMVATALPDAPASSNRGRDWFEEVIRTSSFAMSGYFLGVTTGKAEVVIGYPVLDRRDRVAQVLSVTIGLHALNADSATLLDHSIVMVLDRNGTILARDPDPDRWVGRTLNSVAVMDVLRSGQPERVVESDGLDGTPRFIGYLALPVANGSPGVYLAIGTDRERILAPINRALLISASGLVLVTALMLGAIVIGGRRLVLSPVDQLLQVTRRIGAGDLDARADDRLHREAGELGELARTLNEMATQLQNRSAERIRSEQAIQASEGQLRSTVDVLRKAQQIAHLGNWELDVPTGALTWSDEIYRIFGREPQSFTPTHDAFLGTIHPDDRQAVVDAMRAALDGECPYNIEHRILRPDGVERVVHEQAEVYRDEREQPLQMIGTVLDITERNRAEEALRRTQTQLRRLLDSSPVAIYSLQAGPDLRRTFLSENVTSILGYEPQQFIDDASLWRDRLHPDEVHRTLPELRRVLEHGVASLQYRFRHKDGHYVWVRDESKLIRDANGGPLEILGVLEDVTARVELDEQLRQAQKMEAVGQLAGGIAHDFNNLLQVIGGHAELLLAMPDVRDAVHARARTIRTAADRGATLVRRLLAYSRRQVLEPRIVDVNRFVVDVKAMMDPVVGDDLSIETLLAPDLAAVSIDHNQFEQVLMNLLMNARDAMSGGGVITIATAMVELGADNAHRPFAVPAGRYVAVSVRDRGPGIDDETLPHLFEPFFTTKPAEKGVGLGLASVYGVLTQSRGYIAVFSERGRGTTFTALLPPV